MATFERHRDEKYPGVYYIDGKAIGTGKPDKIFYIRYRKDGKAIEEKAGRASQNKMTFAKAARKRLNRIEGRELPNTEKREAEEATKKAEDGPLYHIEAVDRLHGSQAESKGHCHR
jgi:hypothetical protein